MSAGARRQPRTLSRGRKRVKGRRKTARSHLAEAAYARDGHIAAVVLLAPNRRGAAFRLTGTRNGRAIASAIVKLAS